MKNAKLSDIVGIINKIAPPVLAESWDNSGLQTGDPNAEISRIMVALEPTLKVIESAIEDRCQLLLTHHPLIFKPLSSLSTSTLSGKSLHTAIKSDLAIFSIHTNYDTAIGGLNDILAQFLAVTDTKPLRKSFLQELVKLVVFVPEADLSKVRLALSTFAAQLGSYSDCSFSSEGNGTFTPLNGAHPHIGTVGKRESVRESRLEILIDRNDISRAVSKLRQVHPYEEPAFDLYPTINQGECNGLGRIGKLAETTNLNDYANFVSERLQTPLRYVGDPDKLINSVALCSGSGASLMHDAMRLGADLLVTGDLKYHEAEEAKSRGLAIIDAGHFPTEIIMAKAVQKRLQNDIDCNGYSVSVSVSTAELDPFTFLIQNK